MPRKASSEKEQLKPVELDRSRTPLVIGAVVFVGVAFSVGAIMWGTSDTGEINVSATIANSQYVAENAGEGGSNPGFQAATEQHAAMPNGGLQPRGSDSVPAPTPEPAPIESASTTGEGAEASESSEGSVDDSVSGETEGEQSEETVSEEMNTESIPVTE